MPFTFKTLSIQGLLLIKPRIFTDSRGYFCETYKHSDFAQGGIDFPFVQDNHSFSPKGILRGLHFQMEPHGQGKLVRAIGGRIWDVAVDLREDSPTFGKWEGVELSDENGCMLWIPGGFAHGFVVLSETVHLLYKCTAEYSAASESGIRWDDPDLAIKWPISDVSVSDKDAQLGSFRESYKFPKMEET
ncbi:MAG: dTDP-4-dehydrorhamnose 3,5-epimerase [Rectinemataceae bacterium]|nr:dTDP-4-dehydrorhamnose 3,5-epimerase [Rectinemataceae bacterium]